MSSKIKNIWAIGRNYAEHAKELKNEIPKNPLIFLKSGNCLTSLSLLHLPDWSKEIHHELELAFWVNEDLQFTHITLALDLTARDAQKLAKEKGMPWTLAKSFIGSCPIGPWVSLNEINNLNNLQIELKINNQIKQIGDISDMIFAPQTVLQYVRTHFPIGAYDVILTGTPAGVGPLKSGDKLEATLRDKTQSTQQPILVCHWDVN